jgi:hypothetical protein
MRVLFSTTAGTIATEIATLPDVSECVTILGELATERSKGFVGR